jgi:exosortase
VLCAALLAALAWSYWPALGGLAQRWAHDPQYSHGYLVPGFAAVVLWRRRKAFPRGGLRTSWWGVAVLAGAAALRLVGGWFYLDWLEGASLLLSLLGVAVLAGGWRLAYWALPGVAVLLCMVPPPYAVETALAEPLRGAATAASTFVLQTLGQPAVAEGNTIWIDDLPIGVVEACSGLGMLAAFFAISATVALAVDRPWYDRLVVFLSAAPVGVAMNVLRVTATAFVYRALGGEAARVFFHDLAGWLMMPLACLVLWLELGLLARLFVPRPAAGPVGPPVPATLAPHAAQTPGADTPGSPAPPRNAPSSALTR